MKQVEDALELARGLIGESSAFDPQISDLTGLVRRYSTIEFDVPKLADADGYLFQYCKINSASDPTFALGLVRQLEVVDSLGRYKYYIQIEFEFTYTLDDELDAAGSRTDWWFPGDGTSFDAWLESVDRDPIMKTLSPKTPRWFEIRQDQV